VERKWLAGFTMFYSMIRITATEVAAAAIFAAVAFSGCSTAAPPLPPPPPPQAIPSTAMQGPPAPPPDDWNLFPDPTTGEVDVYHKGTLVGAVNGQEPANEDPPIPHPTAATMQQQDPAPDATP
jgi:hypothetical protein